MCLDDVRERLEQQGIDIPSDAQFDCMSPDAQFQLGSLGPIVPTFKRYTSGLRQRRTGFKPIARFREALRQMVVPRKPDFRGLGPIGTEASMGDHVSFDQLAQQMTEQEIAFEDLPPFVPEEVQAQLVFLPTKPGIVPGPVGKEPPKSERPFSRGQFQISETGLSPKGSVFTRNVGRVRHPGALRQEKVGPIRRWLRKKV